MKLWVKNTILAVILVLIIAVPLLFMGGHEFGGSDDQASDAISELDESYSAKYKADNTGAHSCLKTEEK